MEAGNGFEVTLGLVLWISGVTRYCLRPNIFSGMEGCAIHLFFDIGVSCSIIAIIFFMYSSSSVEESQLHLAADDQTTIKQ